MTHQFFIRSIDNKWRSILHKSIHQVLVFSPYLTEPTAVSVLRHVDPARCDVHTVCSLANFASGASSPRVLRTLLNRGFRLFHIDNLHAKMIIVSGECATLGSQNLTSLGRSNLEASVFLPSGDDATMLEHFVQEWIRLRRPIHEDEIKDLDDRLPQAKREMRKLTRELQVKQDEVDESRRCRERDAEKRRALVAATLATIENMTTPDAVSYEMAKRFVVMSAYQKRGNGKIVDVSVDEQHVVGPSNDWRFDVARGKSNKFLVTRAINRCARISQEAIKNAAAGNPEVFATVRSRMRNAIRGAVAKFNDDEYPSLYGSDPDWVWLGFNGINVDAFLAEFLSQTKLVATFESLGIT